MKAFHNPREAQEFLISEIVAEAQREKRKMLYFAKVVGRFPTS